MKNLKPSNSTELLNNLVNDELNPARYKKAIEAYDTKEDYYASNICNEEYVNYLVDQFEISKEEAIDVRGKLLDEVIRRTSLLDEVLAGPVACELWGIDSSTLRKSKSKFYPSEINTTGRVTRVTVYGMKRVFGEPKTDKGRRYSNSDFL